jgi:ATP-dependent RNA helicase DDX5/DBP2
MNYDTLKNKRNKFENPKISINWSKYSYNFDKNLLQNGSLISSMSISEIKNFYKQYEMTTFGNKIPNPIRTFQEAGFPDYILEELHKSEFHFPTPIQSQGWPMALTGRDVVGIAQTGSGKTLCFGLPALMHICAQPPIKNGEGPIALCIAPTRELAIQIEKDIKPYATVSGISITCIYGGTSKRPQLQIIKKGIEFLIATPGRLLDFLENKEISLFRTTYLVFDEADRMLDMGFVKELNNLLYNSDLKAQRTNLLFSATMDNRILKGIAENNKLVR